MKRKAEAMDLPRTVNVPVSTELIDQQLDRWSPPVQMRFIQDDTAPDGCIIELRTCDQAPQFAGERLETGEP